MKKFLSLFLVICILVIPVLPVNAEDVFSAEIMYAKGGADSIISMSFDDGYYDTAVFLNEQYAEKGLKGSLAFISDRIKNADEETKANWQNLIAQGNLEALSHSASHVYIAPDDGSYPQYEENNTVENYQHEIVDSKADMEEIFGYDPLVFCPAGGIMSGDGFEYVKDNYYSARLTESIGNVVKGHEVLMQTLDPAVGTEPGDWYNLKTLSVYLSGSSQRAQLLCDYVDTAIAQKGWFLPYCHGIVETGDKASANNMTAEDAETFFSYIQQKQNEGKVWCAGIREATVYIRERQASEATVTGDDNSRTVSLKMTEETSDGLSLTGEEFTMPLTVKAEVPAGWETVTCNVNGDTAILNAFSEKAKRYVYVDLVPNGENAVLTMNTEREAGDDHQALDSSLVPFWQAEYVFNESDYDYANLDKFGVLKDDDYLKFPVLIDTYYSQEKIDEAFPENNPPVIMYVINTNTERIGTDSDVQIVSDLINEGYIVLVCDYQNNSLAKSPDLDWSLQLIRSKVLEDKYLNGHTYTNLEEVYILPAGYRLSRNVKYFNYAENGTTGVIQQIIDVWNDDAAGDGTHTAFKKKFGKTSVTLADGTVTTVNDIVADSIEDCVKPDGTPIDLNLYMDIMYPSNPENKVPVMLVSSSSEERVGALTSKLRPHLTGFLFDGYAGAVYDHAYTPMSRTDHYGYFDGTPTGAYTLTHFTGVKSTTAASRRIRYLADAEPEKYSFDVNKVGIYGHSKGANGTVILGTPEPEKETEQSSFAAYTAEDAANDALRQPWLTYESNGEKIPSKVQMAYYSSGSGVEFFSEEGHTPTFTSCGEEDTPYVGVYPQAVNTMRKYDIPSMNFSMKNVGHTILYGKSDEYGIDLYNTLFDFANYWLKDDNAAVQYILPKDGSSEVDVKSEISVKFSGPVSGEEIKNVQIICDATGEEINGTWRSEFGNTLWIFTPAFLNGGQSHTVTVPQFICAENGKALREEKSATFTTKYETSVGALKIDSDKDMLLSKSEESGVYMLFDGASCKNSAKTSIRFSVTNDAAQHVQVYALNDINSDDLKASSQGDLICEVKLAGKGTYEADVTDYVSKNSNGDILGFVLKAEKPAEEKVITDTDFDNRKDPGFTTSSKQYVLDGNACYKNTTSSAMFRLICFGYDDVTEEDFGRRFNITADVYTEKDRTLSAYIGTYQPNVTYSDLNGNTQQFIKAKANTWNKIDLDFVVDNPMYYTENTNKRGLYIAREGTTYDRLVNVLENLYFDNFKVIETITDVNVLEVSDETGTAPCLVLRNSDIENKSAENISYIKNGDDSDSSFEGSFVSGGETAIGSGLYKKVYAEIDMADFNADVQTFIKLNTTNSQSGNIKVYGLKNGFDGIEKLNYLNAPANNRFGNGLNQDELYSSEPIATINVTGAGEYMADVTEYLSYIKENNAEKAGLIFVCDDNQSPIEFTLVENGESSAPAVYSKLINFDDFSELRYSKSSASEITSKYDFTGNAISVTSIDDTVNYGAAGGKSIKIAPSNNTGNIKFYNLFDHELTEADLGRTFDVELYVKVNPGTATSSCAFYMGLMSWGTDSAYNANQYGTESDYIAKTAVPAATTDWVKYTYPLKIEEFMLADATRANNPLLFSIRFATRCSGRIFWLDDLKITETTPSDEEALAVIGAKGKTISNKALADSSALSVTAKNGTSSVYKTYLNFGENNFSNVQRATLKMDVKNSAPHSLNVYAIPSSSYGENLTFNNAPENGAGTSMNIGSVATVNVTDSGNYEIDVTDYIKSNQAYDSIFALTTDDMLGKEYYNQNFETFSFAENVDYELYGDSSVAVNGGECTVNGGIRILNVFGNNAVCDGNTKYKLTADIIPSGSEESCKILLGAAKADTAPEYTKEVALTPGEKTTVTFEFVSGEDDKLTNLVIADISDSQAESFVIDNIVLSSEKTEVQSATLSVATASEANVSYTAGSYIFVAGGEIKVKPDGDTDLVKVNVFNGDKDDFAPELMVAAYKENKLVALYRSEKQAIAKNSSLNIECNTNDLETKDFDSIKLFLWDGMNPLKTETEFVFTEE